LVTQTLASTRWHDHKSVPSAQKRSNGLFLGAFKFREPKILLQSSYQVLIGGNCSLFCRFFSRGHRKKLNINRLLSIWTYKLTYFVEQMFTKRYNFFNQPFIKGKIKNGGQS
jgi:hypothetical protein